MRPCVYFVQARTTGFVKIGFTKDIIARVKALQGSSGDELELLIHSAGTMQHEKFIHRQFAHARVYGEWFRPVPELMEKIEALRQSLGPEKLHNYDSLKAAMYL